MRYGILWTGPTRSLLCEMDGGVCYVNFASEAEARAEADSLNATALQHGWDSRYTAIPLPSGTRYYAGETESVEVTP